MIEPFVGICDGGVDTADGSFGIVLTAGIIATGEGATDGG
jgi:hypothetical protein